MRDEDFPPLDLLRRSLPGPMTPDAYAAAAGTHCPACTGTDLARGSMNSERADTVTRRWACENCGATWTAVYTLIWYDALSVPWEAAGGDATGDPLLAHWGEPHVTDDTPCFCGARVEDGVVVHRRMPWEHPGQREGEA